MSLRFRRLLVLALGAQPLVLPIALAAQQRTGGRVTPPRDTPPRDTPPRDTLTQADREALRKSGRDARAMVRGRQQGDSVVRKARADSASATAFGSEEAPSETTVSGT